MIHNMNPCSSTVAVGSPGSGERGQPRGLRTALPLLAALCLLVATHHVTAFCPGTSRPFRIPIVHTHQHETSQSTTTTTSRFAVLEFFEAEKEEKKRKDGQNSNNSNSNDKKKKDRSWIPVKGGFLPNFRNNKEKQGPPPQLLPSSSVVTPSAPSKDTDKNKDKDQSPAVITVTTMDDYKRVVAQEDHKLVCVRFYAPWCRACKAMEAPFQRLARTTPQVKFVQVPLMDSTAMLHQGLGVPSLPFGHVYHPQAGLVEEQSLNKKHIKDFTNLLQTYIDGECQIPQDEN